MNIIALANQKGGVGKTTTAVNLAACVAAAEKRVLLLDLDPQGNASSGIGLDRVLYSEKNVYHVLIDELPIHEALYRTTLDWLKICPADNNLSGAEVELVQSFARELRLKNAFDELRKNYPDMFDYVFIDCPPSLGLLTVNGLTVADYYVIPLQCEYYAMEGLGQFLHTVELVKKGLNKNLSQLGILLTMFDSRNNLSRQVEKEVKEHFGDNVFNTVIPRNVKLSESPSHGKPVILYDIGSSGSQSYLALAQELLARFDKMHQCEEGKLSAAESTQSPTPPEPKEPPSSEPVPIPVESIEPPPPEPVVVAEPPTQPPPENVTEVPPNFVESPEVGTVSAGSVEDTAAEKEAFTELAPQPVVTPDSPDSTETETGLVNEEETVGPMSSMTEKKVPIAEGESEHGIS